jgi:hypothetical protein
MLKPYAAKLRRVGHEAGSLSPWLQVNELFVNFASAGHLHPRTSPR